MGLTLDFSADQAVLDNTVAVTFTSVRTAGNQPAAVGVAGFYPAATGEGAPSYGVYAKGRARFSLKVSDIAAVGGAKPRDTVTTGDGTVYTVLTAEKGVISGVWQLDCVNLILAADLRQTGVLKRPTNAQDAAYRASLAAYADVATGVPCRVQPTDNRAADVMGRRTTPNTATAFVVVQLDARAKDVFVVDGVTWTVLGSLMPERIDELQRLTLEQVL